MKKTNMSPYTLDQLATAWMKRRRSVLAAMPGLTNDKGSVQAEADLCAIKHPIFPPFSASGEMTGQAMIGDRLLCQLAPEVKIRWRAYRIERVCQWDDWEFSSETALLPGEAGVVVRWRAKNLAKTRRKLPFGILLSGRGRNSKGEGYAWSVPEIPTDVINLRARTGLRTGISKGSIPNSLLFQSKDEPACTLQVASTGAKVSKENSRFNWDVNLAAGAEWQGSLLCAYGTTPREVSALAGQWHDRIDDAFTTSKAWWEELWTAAFTPDSNHFSGHMPVLETSNKAVAKLYYTGILTLLCLRRCYKDSLLKTAYLTLAPRRGEGSIYLAWDLPYIAPVLARLDPEALAEHWKLLCTAPLFSHMCVNLFNGEHLSFPCVSDPLARITPVLELAKRNRLGSLLETKIVRSGKAVTKFKKNGEAVYGPDKKTQLSGADALIEAATAQKLFALGKTGLVDFGDRGNYLECTTTYAHGTAGHTAVQYAALRDLKGLRKKAVATDAEARRMRDAVLGLYRKGEGFFDCEHTDGERHAARNIYDIGLVLNALGTELPAAMVREIASFVQRDLVTPTWARCIASYDPDSASGLRCDHQWAGCFGAWPGQFISGLNKAGHRPRWVVDWVEGLAKVTAQGPFAQAYFAEDVMTPEAGGAAKAFDDLPQGNHWLTCSGAFYSHMVLESLLGHDEKTGKLDLWPGLRGSFRIGSPTPRK
jgi:hypothetical protein